MDVDIKKVIAEAMQTVADLQYELWVSKAHNQQLIDENEFLKSKQKESEE